MTAPRRARDTETIRRLEAEWAEFAESQQLRRRLEIWAVDDDRLAFKNGHELLAKAQQRTPGDWGQRDAVLAALLDLYPSDETARRVALQVVLPGVKHLIDDLACWEPEERAARMVAFACDVLAQCAASPARTPPNFRVFTNTRRKAIRAAVRARANPELLVDDLAKVADLTSLDSETGLQGAIVHRLKERGASSTRRNWVMLPIFLTKSRLTFDLYVPQRVQAQGLPGLDGLKLALPYYDMSAAVWLRLLLRCLWGIEATRIGWVNTRKPTERHTHYLSGADANEGDNPIIEDSNETVTSLVEGKKADAVLGVGALEESTLSQAGLVPLFTDESLLDILTRCIRELGYLPMNHSVLAQGMALETWPHLTDEFRVSVEWSKRAAYRTNPRARRFALSSGASVDLARFWRDPYPTGIPANHRPLVDFIGQMVLDGSLSKEVDPEALF